MRRYAPSDTRRNCADVSGLKTAPGRHLERVGRHEVTPTDRTPIDCPVNREIINAVSTCSSGIPASRAGISVSPLSCSLTRRTIR